MQQHRRKNRDDGYHYEEFDECEIPCAFCMRFFHVITPFLNHSLIGM